MNVNEEKKKDDVIISEKISKILGIGCTYNLALQCTTSDELIQKINERLQLTLKTETSDVVLGSFETAVAPRK